MSSPGRPVSIDRDRLRALRVASDLSLPRLAAEVNMRVGAYEVSAPHLQRLESGATTSAQSWLLVVLAEVLRCAPGELLVSRSATSPAGSAAEGGADVIALAPRGRGRKGPRRVPRALAV